MTYRIQKYRCVLVKDGRVTSVARGEVSCSESAAVLFRPVFARIPHEEVWMALVDGKNSVLGLVRVGQGGLHGCALRPSDVLRPVIAAGASAFILAHNHPSGDPKPSAEDIEMTRRLDRASVCVGVTCLDHIIVTHGGPWRSLRDVPGCFDSEAYES